jgi:hypothetical protein
MIVAFDYDFVRFSIVPRAASATDPSSRRASFAA